LSIYVFVHPYERYLNPHQLRAVWLDNCSVGSYGQSARRGNSRASLKKPPSIDEKGQA